MEVYLNPVKYCKTPTGHPKGHPCCKIADYDDTALGTGTLTVHPWRAGPDCGKLLLLLSTTPNTTKIFLIIFKLIQHYGHYELSCEEKSKFEFEEKKSSVYY
jgi:hypothetical protein